MSVVITEAAVNDIILTWAETITAELEAALNAISGAAISAASVPTSALAKPRSFMTVAICREFDLTATNVTGVGAWKVPQLDGASSTLYYLGASVVFPQDEAGTETLTADASAFFAVKLINGGSTTTIHQIDLNSTNITGVAVPYQVNAASPVAVASGQYIRVDYDRGGSAGEYPNPIIHLHFSVIHVGS